MGPCVPEPRRNIVAPLTAVAGVLERELLLLSVPKSRVMWRWSDLLRCPLSHAMSSGFIGRFVSFFRPSPPQARGAPADASACA
jgi:hypothetical protein